MIQGNKEEKIKTEEIKPNDILVTEEVESQEETSNPEQELDSPHLEPKEKPEVDIPNFSNPGQRSSSGKKYFLIILVVVLVLALVAGAIFVYRKSMKKGSSQEQNSSEVVTPTPTPVQTEEASPAAELRREDLKVEILNGSGIAGEAKKAKDMLEELGYVDVKIGNADSYDYTKAEISLKKEKQDYFDLLTSDLSEEYKVSKTLETLDENSDFDAIVILGK